MSLPYYKFYPSDDLGNYQLQTLTHDMLGVWYLLRICQLWPHQGRIPDDPDYIAPLLRLTADKWQTCRTEFLKRGLIQIIDDCVTIAEFRDRWEKAQIYTEGQRSDKLEQSRLKKENQILRNGKKKR